MESPNFPSKEDVQSVIESVETRLKADLDADVRQAFEICLELLKLDKKNDFYIATEESELEDANEIYRNQILPFKVLKTVRSRTMCVMCQDYLNGNDDAKIFTQIGEK